MTKVKALILFILIAALPVKAGPFLKITSVDGKSDYPRVILNLTVSGHGTAGIGDLSEENIFIYEDGYRAGHVRVLNYSETSDYLYLVFSIDSSKSISNDFMKGIKAAASEIVTSAGAKDQIAVYRFNGESVLLNNFTSKKDELVRNIGTIQNQGKKTLLFNTIFDALELLNNIKGERKALIVFTDGRDDGSSVTDNDVIDFSRKYGVPVFFIAMKPEKDLNRIARVAKLTGGKVALSNKTEDLSGMYRSVLTAVKSRYVVKYITMFKPDGKTRQIEARLNYGSIRDRDTHDIVFDGKDFLNFSPDRNTLLLSGVIILIIVLLFLIIIVFGGVKKRLQAVRNSDSSYPVIRRTDCNSYDAAESDDESQPDYDTDDADNITDTKEYRKAWLLIKGLKSSSGRYDIMKEEICIGSGSDCDLMIQDDDISEKHLKLKYTEGGYYVFDLISDNGTYLNGKKLLRPRSLFDWDEIKIGSTLIVFRGRA